MLKGCRSAYALRHPHFCVKSGLSEKKGPLFHFYFDIVKINVVEREYGLQGSNNVRFRSFLSRAVSLIPFPVRHHVHRSAA